MKALIEDILDFAYEQDMLDKNNILQQSNKIRVDVDRMHTAIISKSKGMKEYINHGNKIAKTDEDIRSYIGKLMFDLVILAELNDVDLSGVLLETYKNRK